MAINFKQMEEEAPKKNSFGRVEDGTYPARIVQLIMLGSQLQTDWKTGEAKEDKEGNLVYSDEIWVTYEFPTERIKYTDSEDVEHDRPRWQSKTYILSMFEKANFRKLLDAVAPEAEDLSGLINSPCIVTIGSTSGNKAKVKSVSAPVKGMEVPPLENPAQIYDLDEPDEEVFDGLPDFLKEKINNRKLDEDEFEPIRSGDSDKEDPFAA